MGGKERLPLFVWHEEGSGDSAVERGKNGSIRSRKLSEVAVCCLLGSPHPFRKVRNVMIIGNKCEMSGGIRFYLKQQASRLIYIESVLRRLTYDANKSEFCNCTGRQFRSAAHSQLAQPAHSAIMEFMISYAKRYQHTHIEQKSHGKSARIS